ncbi:MAG: Hsp70 family protein [Planctomycetes bacterium]|nr:Hsp70 family protein [Planctomycetota bacterium]
MTVPEPVVGIDLGTTNSEVAALVDGRVRVLGPGDTRMLPSCVGLSLSGELLIGQAARNQQLLYPERTVRSIKRKMGANESVTLGDKVFSPQEVSALILRELAEWARRSLQAPVRKAVITVPAYFSDAQRNATREAGALAGLEVIRILNEPTAASLAYGHGDGKRRTVMIYDLGGGTFDVSIVTLENEVTEVLASHGDTHLGGDDFDDLLAERLVRTFQDKHGVDLRRGHPAAYSRVWWAAEEAKRKLSYEPRVKVREEALVVRDGTPLHLETELVRDEYEDLIRPLIERTLASVSKAMQDAGKKPGDLDAILLVGGATRTPLVQRVLEERTGQTPRQEVHPDLCVALGAGVLASRLAGHEVERVLVDISPYSFGPSHLGLRDGRPYPHCYTSIIRRNTPLPVTRAERYFTAAPFQERVEIEIFQGDDPDALKNTLVGSFSINDLTPTEEQNEVICRMSLDLDGILHVTATETKSGKSKQVSIANALAQKSEAELAAAQERMRALHAERSEELDELFQDPTEDDDAAGGEEEDDGAEAGAEEEAGAPGLDGLREGREEVELRPSVVGLGRDTVSAASEAACSSSAAPDSTHVAVAAAAGSPEWVEAMRRSRELLERSRRLLEGMHEEDREETIGLNERIESSISRRDAKALSGATESLRELLFFVEGKK